MSVQELKQPRSTCRLRCLRETRIQTTSKPSRTCFPSCKKGTVFKQWFKPAERQSRGGARSLCPRPHRALPDPGCAAGGAAGLQK